MCNLMHLVKEKADRGEVWPQTRINLYQSLVDSLSIDDEFTLMIHCTNNVIIDRTVAAALGHVLKYFGGCRPRILIYSCNKNNRAIANKFKAANIDVVVISDDRESLDILEIDGGANRYLNTLYSMIEQSHSLLLFGGERDSDIKYLTELATDKGMLTSKPRIRTYRS